MNRGARGDAHQDREGVGAAAAVYFWPCLASLHLGVVQQRMRERVWEATNVRLTSITLDTDTIVHTLYGQPMGARKSYNPKNKGKKSYQPILTFLAETREYIWGELRNGHRPTGEQIACHLHSVSGARDSLAIVNRAYDFMHLQPRAANKLQRTTEQFREKRQIRRQSRN